MHRFRKRSDARRVPVPESLPYTADTQEILPSLPPASDFRTSLILPDLTRRFSVLQNSSGGPIGLDELKNKFAEQRARGSHNQVTEEEEDMILEALGRLNGRKPRSRGPQSGYESSEGRSTTATGEDDDLDAMRQSVLSSTSATTPSLHGAASIASLSSTKGSQTSRRMSNNLFGSGKFRDQAYFLRNTNTGRRSGRGAGTIAQSDSTLSTSTIGSARTENGTSMYSDSLRPVTPEGSSYTHSAPSSPGNNSTFSKDRSSRSTTGEQSDYMPSSISKRLSKVLSPDGVRRASMALDQAIRELEEEGDDEIVMERSPVVHAPARDMNGSLAALTTALEPIASSPLPSPGEESGTALSSDDPISTDESQRMSPYPSSRTTSPTPRLPGYIPGMPRPMTPRDATFDNEDLTPSATPRATSPRLPGLNTQASPLIPQSIASALNRSNSGASASHQAVRPVSPAQASTPPLFFNRPMNGRYTPEDRPRNTSKLPSPTSDAPDSPVMGRRRPMSPLSAPAFQPLAAAASSSRPSSRPGTPSNVTWSTPSSPNGTPQKSHGRNGSVSGHSRNGSTTSVTDQGADNLDRSKSTSRSLRSPALPDSPWVDNGHTGSYAITQPDYRPPSAMSGMDLGSPVQLVNRALRSPTPTYNGARSPTSPTFQDFGAINGDGATLSARSSKQNHHGSSNSFSLSTPNALLFSPIANSSRSSLESAGSSYHTWDEDHKKDRLSGLLSNLDADHAPWHDISPDKSGPSTAGTSPYDSLEPEDAVRREIGLTKTDFVVIQDKLIGAAVSKAATPDTRARAGSIRRRRPSTSQSNYSYSGDNRAVNATPQPQPQPQLAAGPSRPSATDHVAKANALLNAVVDSIESPAAPSAKALPTEESSLAVPAPADLEQSSPMRRNRALADALFGSEEHERSLSSPEPPQISIMPEFSDPEPDEDEPPAPKTKPLQTPKRSDSLRHPGSPKAATPTPPAHTMPNAPLSPLSPTSGMNPSQLALEVQRRAEAATAALRKSPSIPKIADGSGTVPRKRISPNKISSPTLVSASTSVDAIPLRSPTASPSPQMLQTSSKIGSRFKKLRGTIRAKPHIAPTGEEVTPYPLDLRSPTSAGNGMPSGSSPSLALRTSPIPMSASAAEPVRLKPPPAPLPSPPASAGPGLKGFMARFRKSRPPEPLVAPARPAPGPMSATTAKSMGLLSGMAPEEPYGPMPHSAPALKTMFRSPSPAGPTAPPPQSPTPRPPQEGFAAAPSVQAQTQTNDALRQLFDAATNLGLDQAALNDLIARSPSTSSRSTAWTRLTRATSPNESRKSHVPVIRGRATPDSVRSPTSEGRPSFDGYSPRPSTDTRPPVRKVQESPQRPRQQQQDAAQNTVVRRTIIFPSDARASGFDLGALVRKQSASRRRASVGSKSSIHDRVPTPPPPHRAGGRRFSTDAASPPVPHLPPSFSATTEGSLAVPTGVEKSSSAYDSLYEMYAGESRGQILGAESPGAGSSQAQREAIPESGPALEVIEMANGETIWSIVNGLRDDDGESFYGDRASFYSEYSVKDTNENVKLFFKEHERKSSKGSTSSFLSRKKQQQQQVQQQQQQQQPKGTARPETKVFFSSSAQIGRLIENLSRGMDAGSFNITPGQGGRSQGHVGHSAASSVGSDADMRWTVEERLEQMLGSMGAG